MGNLQLCTQCMFQKIRETLAYFRVCIAIIGILSFSTYVVAQNTAQSGNIRECGTWVKGTTMLFNTNIGSGHIVEAKGTTFLSSMTLNNNGAVNFSADPASNGINFYNAPNFTDVPGYCSYSASTPNFPNIDSWDYQVNTHTAYFRQFRSNYIYIPTDKGFPTGGDGIPVSLEISVNITKLPPHNGTLGYVFCNNTIAAEHLDDVIKTWVYINSSGIPDYIEYAGPDGATRTQTKTVELKVHAGESILIQVGVYLATGYTSIPEICPPGVAYKSCITTGQTYPNWDSKCTSSIGPMNMDVNFTISTKNSPF